MPETVNLIWNWSNKSKIKTKWQNYINLSFATYPYSWGEDNKDSVKDDQDGEKAQKKEPEPEEDVDFLIHWGKFRFKI